MATLLPKKATSAPVATNDTHLTIMAADPSISAIPQDTSWSALNSQGTTVVEQPKDKTMPEQQKSTALTEAVTGETLVNNDNTDWINRRWRPVMGWTYMVTCIADFVVFPVLWSILQTLSSGQISSQWQPLTLQGAGLYHIAMGAVLGIAAYGRTKEKIEGRA